MRVVVIIIVIAFGVGLPVSRVEIGIFKIQHEDKIYSQTRYNRVGIVSKSCFVMFCWFQVLPPHFMFLSFCILISCYFPFSLLFMFLPCVLISLNFPFKFLSYCACMSFHLPVSFLSIWVSQLFMSASNFQLQRK